MGDLMEAGKEPEVDQMEEDGDLEVDQTKDGDLEVDQVEDGDRQVKLQMEDGGSGGGAAGGAWESGWWNRWRMWIWRWKQMEDADLDVEPMEEGGSGGGSDGGSGSGRWNRWRMEEIVVLQRGEVARANPGEQPTAVGAIMPTEASSIALAPFESVLDLNRFSMLSQLCMVFRESS